MNKKPISNLIWQLLSKLTAETVIRAFQNGKEPEKPFITYALRWQTMPVHFNHSKIEDDGQQQTKTHIEATLELQAFGDDALARLQRVCFLLKTPEHHAKWLASDLVVVEIGKISDTPYLNEAHAYEQRAIVEIRLRYSLSHTAPMPYFDRVEICDLDQRKTIITDIKELNNG